MKIIIIICIISILRTIVCWTTSHTEVLDPAPYLSPRPPFTPLGVMFNKVQQQQKKGSTFNVLPLRGNNVKEFDIPNSPAINIPSKDIDTDTSAVNSNINKKNGIIKLYTDMYPYYGRYNVAIKPNIVTNLRPIFEANNEQTNKNICQYNNQIVKNNPQLNKLHPYVFKPTNFKQFEANLNEYYHYTPMNYNIDRSGIGLYNGYKYGAFNYNGYPLAVRGLPLNQHVRSGWFGGWGNGRWGHYGTG